MRRVAAAAPFELSAAGGDRKAHFACARFNAEMREQSGEVGIIQLVVDDESGVDSDARAVVIDVDGMAVTARADFLFVNRDLMPS